MRYEETRKVVGDSTKALCKALNGGSRKDAVAGLLEVLTREHRYLQSEVIWALLEALGSMATERTDARNEAAIRACGDLRKAVGDRIYWPEDWK